MRYDLVIGDRAYSSWSLRGWLLFNSFGLPVQTQSARLYTEELPRLLTAFAPARTAPALRLPEGVAIGESLAIAEEIATRHPEAGIWPEDPALRATARMLAAEMHSGFAALRDYCPMNLRVSYQSCEPPPAVLADLARIELLWSHARGLTAVRQKTGSPWLFGAWSAADVFFSPIAARIAGYNLPVGADAQAYVNAHLAHPSFRRWRAMARVDGADQPFYRRDWPKRDWPGPVPLQARAVERGESENRACPYSGKPVTHMLELAGRHIGFCNAFCRDKTAADPEAWPAFMALFRSTSPTP